MSFQTPGGPAAKRRRTEAANVTLRKPFRSPLISRQQNEPGAHGAHNSPTVGRSPSITPRAPTTPAPSRSTRPAARASGTAAPTTAPSPLSTSPGLTYKTTPQPKRSLLANPASRSTRGSAKPAKLSKPTTTTTPITSRTSRTSRTTLGPGADHDKKDAGQDDEITNPNNLLQQINACQRSLQTQLRATQQRLELVRQARRIEEVSRARGSSDHQSGRASGTALEGGERNEEVVSKVDVDTGLRELVAKWKGASRLAAEDLFELIKDRVEGMGGARAWRESRAWQRAGGGFGDGDENGGGLKRDGEEEGEEVEGYEDDGLRENGKGEGEEEDGESEESEFTMLMMLRSLNIDPEVLGYDPVEDKWRD